MQVIARLLASSSHQISKAVCIRADSSKADYASINTTQLESDYYAAVGNHSVMLMPQLCLRINFWRHRVGMNVNMAPVAFEFAGPYSQLVKSRLAAMPSVGIFYNFMGTAD